MLASIACRFALFLLSAHGAPRALHSFPTRRSSDLGPVVGHEYRAVLGQHDVGRPTKIDRKSTRLNSSHVRISYAVFCLKKKTRRPVFPVPLSLSRRRSRLARAWLLRSASQVHLPHC